MGSPVVSRSRAFMLVLTAVAVTALLTTMGPAAAQRAINAQTLSGRPGVGCTAGHDARAGGYVATCASGASKGFLPNDIIKEAPDSAKLGGLPASRYFSSASGASIGSILAHPLTGATETTMCCSRVAVRRANTVVITSSTMQLYTLSAVHSQAHCRLAQRAPGEAELSPFGQTSWAEFPASSSWDVPLSQTGSFLAPAPGSYDVGVLCAEDLGDVAFFSGDIVGWTVPNPGPA